jgi:AcrR family transcriptional regulator
MTDLVEKTMKNKEKQDRVREEIIAEASRLFQKYGYLKTSMEDIAKATKKGEKLALLLLQE